MGSAAAGGAEAAVPVGDDKGNDGDAAVIGKEEGAPLKGADFPAIGAQISLGEEVDRTALP